MPSSGMPESFALHSSAAISRSHCRSAYADVTGLADEQRPPIAVVDLGEHPVKRLPARIPRRVFPPQPFAGVFPLIRVVEIDAHDVEITGMPAQFRPLNASQHVP